jgi:hypothetical protein
MKKTFFSAAGFGDPMGCFKNLVYLHGLLGLVNKKGKILAGTLQMT